MEKIVIIGSSGAGKSTVARNLGSVLKIKVFHLDRLFWLPGWKEKTKDTRIDILQSLLQRKQWIIDGTYLNSSEELHLKEADTIIFLDIPLLRCLQRIITRHYEDYGRPRRDISMGSTDKLTPRQILKVLFFPFLDGRTIKQRLRYYKAKQIIWLRSAKDVKSFIAQQGQPVDGKRYYISRRRERRA